MLDWRRCGRPWNEPRLYRSRKHGAETPAGSSQRLRTEHQVTPRASVDGWACASIRVTKAPAPARPPPAAVRPSGRATAPSAPGFAGWPGCARPPARSPLPIGRLRPRDGRARNAAPPSAAPRHGRRRPLDPRHPGPGFPRRILIIIFGTWHRAGRQNAGIEYTAQHHAHALARGQRQKPSSAGCSRSE